MKKRVVVIVCAWNHLETTTRPCVESLLAFTEYPARFLLIDNGSDDGTPSWISIRATQDSRLALVSLKKNRGWAGGSLEGLERLGPRDTHVCLLNSDTMVSPGWLGRLIGHLERHPGTDAVVPNEHPHIPEFFDSPQWAALRPSPSLETIREAGSVVHRVFDGMSQPAGPSGYCLLMSRDRVPLLTRYLEDFPRYLAGELRWQEFFEHHQLSCRLALDTFVYHARGGSGGYAFGPSTASRQNSFLGRTKQFWPPGSGMDGLQSIMSHSRGQGPRPSRRKRVTRGGFTMKAPGTASGAITMANLIKKLEKARNEVLESGEEIRAACIVQPKGSVKRQAIGGGLGGALGAAIAHAATRKDKDAPKEGIAATWPADRLLVALTDRRLVACTLKAMSGGVKEVATACPRGEVTDITFTKGFLVGKLRLAFADGSAIVLDAPRFAKCHELASAFASA